MYMEQKAGSQGGQILVEYVLILTIVIAIASTVMKTIVGRSQDSPGAIISVWNAMLVVIAEDTPD